MFAAGDDFKIISTHAPRTARKSIFKLWKMCYTVRMDRTTLIDFFEEVETTEEHEWILLLHCRRHYIVSEMRERQRANPKS